MEIPGDGAHAFSVLIDLTKLPSKVSNLYSQQGLRMAVSLMSSSALDIVSFEYPNVCKHRL